MLEQGNAVQYKILEGENFGELQQNRQKFVVQNFLQKFVIRKYVVFVCASG